MHTARALLTAALMFFLFVAAPLWAEDPGFETSRAEVFSRVKRVGLLPLQYSDDYRGVPPDFRERVEAMLAAKLQAAGFEVVPSAAYKAAFDTMNRQVGGIYDPRTGIADQQKSSTVRDHAERSFIESERLDAIVFNAIVLRRAEYSGWTARWDGVEERSNGKAPGKNALASFWNEPTGSTGHLPALSFGLLIVDAERNDLFYGRGGIQLVGYLEDGKGLLGKTETVHGFLQVSSEELLRDLLRVERAVDVATENLRVTPEQRIAAEAEKKRIKRLPKEKRPPQSVAAELPPLPAGAPPKPEVPLKVSRDELLDRVKSVGVVIEAEDGGKSAEVAKRAAEQAAVEFGRIGWRVADSQPLSALLKAAKEKSGGFFDPLTGEHDVSREAAMRIAVVEEFRKTSPIDAVLWPSLVPRSAPHDGGNAVWDGASQNAVSLGPVTRFGSPQLGSGSVTALSYLMELRSADDQLLYKDYGGVQLLEKLTPVSSGLPTRTRLTDIELFTDPERDRRAVHLALRNLVLTPAELEAELNPKKAQRAKEGN